ncbi:MAG TPA: sigma-70 family RNA polymerase sigma factor, partial [Methylomirabilota bacterium]|nr:sigma-70 family RNA polymerase sigma factor [Methylomirabilota bacterium]
MSGGPEDDRDVVRRVQGGETEAFEHLVDKYKRKVFRLAFGVLRDQDEAMDVAQEAFVKAYRALPRFKGDSAFYTWLFRITMNVALDRKRQRAARARALGTDDVPPEEWERTAVSPDPDPADEAAGSERRARIARALESLPEHHRSIIILGDIEGLAYREIAEVLGIPMGTVMSRLHHARRRLREVLGTGLAALLVAAALALLVSPAGHAQVPPPGGPGYPPPGVLPPAGIRPAPAGLQVCVSALVLLAASPPPGQILGPAPDVKSDEPGSPAAGAGCGQPWDFQPWVPRLRAVFGYSTYQTMSAFETLMPLGMAQRFALPGGRELEIQPLGVRPPVVRILVKVKRHGLPELATVMDVP